MNRRKRFGAFPLKQNKLKQKPREAWTILCRAVKRFFGIDGGYWAGAFAFNAFFSLFPLMILLVTIASLFVDRTWAGKAVVDHIETYVPINSVMQSYIFNTISGVIDKREQASVIAFLMLVWVALQCFSSLIRATNRAWGGTVNNWWRLPLKSLALLGITAGAVLIGIAVPILTKMGKGRLFSVNNFNSLIYALGSFFIPLLVVFFGLGLFYKLAPRRPTRFAEVWIAALFATVLLRMAESLFVIYMRDFTTLNAVYGTFGGIMALLLWIYISGYVFIFGACLCVAQAGLHHASANSRGQTR